MFRPVYLDLPSGEISSGPSKFDARPRYFEPFELEHVRVVVAESAALTPLEVEELRKGIMLPPGLWAWADTRAGRTPDV